MSSTSSHPAAAVPPDGSDDYSHIQVTIENAHITVPAVLDLVLQLAEFEKAANCVKATQELLYLNLLGVQKPTQKSETGVVVSPADAAGETTRRRRYADCIMVYKGGLHGEAVGMAVYFRNFSTWTSKGGLYLEDLFVSPAHRSRGIAKSLFAALARIAVDEDLARIDWSVLNWNVSAKKVYQAMGAELRDEWESMRLEGEAITNLLV